MQEKTLLENEKWGYNRIKKRLIMKKGLSEFIAGIVLWIMMNLAIVIFFCGGIFGLYVTYAVIEAFIDGEEGFELVVFCGVGTLGSLYMCRKVFILYYKDVKE